MKNEIGTVHVKFERASRLINAVTAEYELGPNGFAWAQRLAIWVLRRCGARCIMPITVMRRSKEQNDDLLMRLIRQEQWALNELGDRRGLRIYIGPDEDRELAAWMDEQGHGAPLSLSGSIKIGHPGLDGRTPFYTWHDIPIYVLPWMTGALLVPGARHGFP